ncbi:MAG: GGDEF domain-containing protein [Candidatus Eisenbacteria bacterium]|uniref:GGDEF domain-containing protein n=1 Tax=Eiseniibacteriota bacterium TaxID=2212470 RepID=A0A938BLZ5_UNCEI|nr:GGDEF domain-containing protein [Candidatus Eisenbacteria bacterium]
MEQPVRTTYSGLLAKLLEGGYFEPSEGDRVRLLLERDDAALLAQGAHDFVRHLLRSGRLEPHEGDPRDPAAPLAAADTLRGRIFRLPALDGPEPGVLEPSLDPLSGPPAGFAPEALWTLVRAMSGRGLASVAEAADLRGVLLTALDLVRELLECPTALGFSEGLPLPPGIARGPRASVLGDSLEPPAPESAEALPTILPAPWSHWARRAAPLQGACLHLSDFSRIEASRRPAPSGSALLVPLQPSCPNGRLVLAAVSSQPFRFHEGRLARLRLLVPHFRRMLDHSLGLQEVVARDFLTGVYNRAHFEDQLTRALADALRHNQRFALLIADIDDFRQVNSRYGYDAGDTALRTVAERLSGALRSTDILARYGGEEFAILLGSDLAAAEANLIGERLRGAVAEAPIGIPTLGGGSASLAATVSIGGALFPLHGRDRDALWQEANRMLLEAKAAGKNRVRFRWEEAGGPP